MIDIDALRDRFARFGELRPQGRDEWRGDIPLPDALADFYARIGPLGKTYHAHIGPVGVTLSETNVCFPALSRLWDLQAGYRWDASNGQRVPAWQDNWLVIADLNADPFILDTGSGRILYAVHGTGTWAPDDIAPDLWTLAAALAAVGEIYLDADEDLRDDDWEIKPAYRDAVLDRLTAVLGDRGEAERFCEVLQG